MNEAMKKDLAKHPCFNPAVKGRFGRVHLPVAPKCNIKCNYCNRKYDCVNESRPGVTSTVLSPKQALVYMNKVLAAEPRITVAGIAGPGDPFANADATMETMRLIRREFPDMILCLASNGLAISPYIEELAEIDVSHVTITVNAVDLEIGRKIYGWVSDGNMVFRGRQAAELLLRRQLEAIRKLKAHDITVKINSILIPGINDEHIVEVAAKMKELGVDLFNCMALFPNAGTVFADIEQPSKQLVAEVRSRSEAYLPQMRHCTRCRADAVGLLDNDKTEEFRGCLSACAAMKKTPEKPQRQYVAVATLEGMLINQHLGEAQSFQIWKQEDGEITMVEERKAPQPGDGIRRWIRLSRILQDCTSVLVNGVGETPQEILEQSGLKVYEVGGLIDAGLQVVFKGKKPASVKGRRVSCAAGGCKGTGSGCM
jgi:nitrogen fixation protein NifB